MYTLAPAQFSLLSSHTVTSLTSLNKMVSAAVIAATAAEVLKQLPIPRDSHLAMFLLGASTTIGAWLYCQQLYAPQVPPRVEVDLHLHIHHHDLPPPPRPISPPPCPPLLKATRFHLRSSLS